MALFGQGFRRDVRAVTEALFATDQGPLTDERLEFVVVDVQDFLLHAGARTRLLFRGALFLVCWLAPLLLFSRPLRFARWDRRLRFLLRLERSALGLPFLLVKLSLCAIYFEHEKSLADLRIDGRCLKAAP